MRFFVGIHHPCDAHRFDRAFVSVNTIRKRKKRIGAGEWIMNSGAFTEISTHGYYRHGVEAYAEVINRWAWDPSLLAVVSQDYMCEPWILAKTGMSIVDHQVMTIDRYDELKPLVAPRYVMPVLQGYDPQDYVAHILMYGDRLAHGAWVGVGSVCKRNAKPLSVEAVLTAIKRERPDLKLHGFGLKITALSSAIVWDALETSDSMAWSYRARIERTGRQNDWRAAKEFEEQINNLPVQMGWSF